MTSIVVDRALALVFAAMLALPACHRGDLRPSEAVTTVPPGTVLILPPRDMVQDGGCSPT